MRTLTKRECIRFQSRVWQYYDQYGRHDLPWRQAESHQFDPYKIVVSEIMLQQTQVQRVLPKFEAFVRQFPRVSDLAVAPLATVVTAWSGLGYNRRAKFLWQAAQTITNTYDGVFPQDAAALQALPGVGVNTAGAILAYAFNQPVVFLETNIRTVFIQHFFESRQQVKDKELAELVAQTLDRDQPRQWYWALMDYGSYLKKTVPHVHRASERYVRQTPFEGSKRQIRGRVLRKLITGPQSFEQLSDAITDERLPNVLDDLIAEGFVTSSRLGYTLVA